MTSSRAEPTGLLRINASYGFGRAHVAPAISRFAALHPAIKVVLRWALEGRGIAIRSEWEISRYIQDGELIAMLPEWRLPNSDIHAIYLERHRLSAKLRTFMDFLAGELQRDFPGLDIGHPGELPATHIERDRTRQAT